MVAGHSISLSVCDTSWYCIEMVEWVKLVFSIDPSFVLHCIDSNFQNKCTCTFLGNFVANSVLSNSSLYSAMTLHQHKCYQLSLTTNSSRLSHWAFTFYEQHDGWHIVHHAGLSVVAETCKILLQTTCHCSWTTDSIISYVLTFGSDNNSPLRISIPYIYSRLATNTHINSGVNKLSCLLFSC